MHRRYQASARGFPSADHTSSPSPSSGSLYTGFSDSYVEIAHHTGPSLVNRVTTTMCMLLYLMVGTALLLVGATYLYHSGFVRNCIRARNEYEEIVRIWETEKVPAINHFLDNGHFNLMVEIPADVDHPKATLANISLFKNRKTMHAPVPAYISTQGFTSITLDALDESGNNSTGVYQNIVRELARQSIPVTENRVEDWMKLPGTIWWLSATWKASGNAQGNSGQQFPAAKITQPLFKVRRAWARVRLRSRWPCVHKSTMVMVMGRMIRMIGNHGIR